VSGTRVVVDSSGWIEVFTNGGHADHFLALMADPCSLVVPAITIYEVHKWVLREYGEATARDQQARLHTMDSDFRGIADVEWLESIP
jgi:hypothetical protein